MESNRAVIIAEDDADILDILSNILQGSTFEVHCASDGKAAFQLIQKLKTADLLITDLIMPEIEGLELIKKTRLIRPEIKILAMSGGGLGDKGTYLDLAVRLGADDCIMKPFSRQELIDKIEKVLDQTSWAELRKTS